MRLSPTVLVMRIHALDSARAVRDFMHYDLPYDPVTQALCLALIAALEERDTLDTELTHAMVV